MYYKFKGNDSRDYGITVLTRPKVETPQHRTWTTFVDGKDGATSSHLGFHPYTIEFRIAVEGRDNIDRIMEWMQGKGKFERSDFPGKYIKVYVEEGISFEKRTEWLYEASIILWAYDPFWYKTEDSWKGPYEEGSEMMVVNEGTAKSFPLVKVLKGGDRALVKVNGDGFEYVFPKGESEVVIDSMTKKAYHQEDVRDAFLIFKGETSLSPGENKVSVEGGGQVYFKRVDRWI